MRDSSLAILGLSCGSSRRRRTQLRMVLKKEKRFSRQSRDGKKVECSVQCFLRCGWSLAMLGAGSRLAHWEHIHG